MSQLVLQRPGELSDTELEKFEKLVRQGNEVASQGLPERIRKALVPAFIKSGENVMAVGALKKPEGSYINRIAKCSGNRELAGYKFELGWVYVVPDHRGKRYSSRICKALLEFSAERIFATTRTDNSLMRHVLKRNDFVEVGTSYSSQEHPGKSLSVWIRDAKQQ